MPNVTPVVSETGEFLGAEVTHRANVTNHQGMVAGSPQETNTAPISAPEYGQEVPSFQFDNYIEDLKSVETDLAPIANWIDSAPEIDDATRAKWNQALDNQDLDTFYSMLDNFRALYKANGSPNAPKQKQQNETDAEVSTEQQWLDNLPEEFVKSQVEDLFDNSPDASDVEMYSSAMSSYSSDSVEAAILNYAVQIGNGQTDLPTAFKECIARFGEANAAAAYVTLQNHLN